MKVTGNYRYRLAFCLLAILIFSIYSNSLRSAWHFDDYANIRENPRVQIQDLKLQTIWKTLFASPEGREKPFRSLAYLSFALNAYLHQDAVAGYHVVNIVIHIVTACLLFAVILKLFETPNLSQKHGDDAYFVALLTAVFWAVNPIQTQAVTYIVQRMASMAALFYLLAVYFYIVARLNHATKSRTVQYALCVLSYLCAILSKENAALLPIALLLLEFIFFRNIRDLKTKKEFGLCILAGLLFIVVQGMLLFGNPFGFLDGYPNRTFTPLQRLFTEFRVVTFYLSQIFYPVPTRLSLMHDFAVSTSVFHPLTTLSSILFVLALLALGLYWMGRRPVLSFAILFFFVNHLIESSVIGLEIVFEHRNYLPSLFLFMPVAMGAKRLLDHYRKSNPLMRYFLALAIAFVLIGFGTGTYIRNQAWADEKSLWEDTLSKAPKSIRAYHELAYQFYEKNGHYNAALALYHRGLKFTGQNIYEKTLSLNNIASIHFTKGEYGKAEKYWKEAVDLYPDYKQAYYRLGLAQTKLGEWREASDTLSNILSENYADERCLRLKGIILLHENKPHESIDYFRKAMKMNPDHWQNLMYLGLAHTMSGGIEKGYLFLKMAAAKRTGEPLLQVWLAQNRFIVGRDFDVNAHLDHLIALVGVRNVEYYFNRLINQFNYMESSLNNMRPLLAERLQNIADDIRHSSRLLRSIPIGLTKLSESEISIPVDDVDGSLSN